MLSSKFVVYLNRNTIWIKDFSLKTPQIKEYPWDGIDPRKEFLEISKSFKVDSFKVVLGDSVSYLLIKEFAKENITRSEVLVAAKPEIPEEMGESNFDWQILAKKSKANTYTVQIVAISQDILNAISYVAKTCKLNLVTINPVAILLAQATSKLKTPHLILWSGVERVGVIADQGLVYFSKVINDPFEKNITELIDLAQKMSGFTITGKNIVYSWNGIEKIINLVRPGVSILQTLDPFELSLHKKYSKGRDDRVLTINPIADPTAPVVKKTPLMSTVPESNANKVADQENKMLTQSEFSKEVAKIVKNDAPITEGITTSDKESRQKYPIFQKLIVATFSALIGVGIVYGVTRVTLPKNKSNSALLNVELVSPTPLPTSEPSPSLLDSPVPLKDYQVQVLNGSGIAGEATQVVELLKAQGFTRFTTGNAAVFTYQDTDVSMKATVPESVYLAVEQALSSYSVKKTADLLTNDSDYDLLIIVGDKK